MKNTAIVSFAIALALMPVFAGASAGMNFILDTSEAKLCSCGTVQVTGTLESDVSGVYRIQSDSKWVTVAPDTVSLAAGESVPVYVYITPDCVSPPKDYNIQVSAKSDAGLSASQQITTTILPCHNVALDVSPLTGSACLGESAHFDVNVTNNGKTSEDFAISTTAGTLQTEKITLERGQTKTIGLDIPANDTKTDVTVSAQSASTYASDSKTITLNGMGCYSAGLTLEPEAKSACLNDAANYSVTLKNTGVREDSYQIDSSRGTLSSKYLTLAPGEAKQITLSAASDKEGNYSFDITAISGHAKAEARGTFTAVQCRGVKASIAPTEETVCKGFPVNYSVQIKNSGTLDDIYSLASDTGRLEKENISVRKGESSEVSLAIPEDALQENNTINIKAVSLGDAGISATAKSLLYVQNCYNVSSSAAAPEEKICAGKTAVFGIDIQNTGKLADDYTIDTNLGGLSEKYVTLAPQEKALISAIIPTELNDSGKKQVTLTISSKNSNAMQNLSLDIEPAKDCYGFSVLAKKDTLFTNDSTGQLFEATVLNSGRESANFTDELQGPDWAYISPRKFTLGSGQNATIYLYAAPSFGTKDDAYLMEINVNNTAGFSQKEFVQLVLGNATPLDMSKFKAAAATGRAAKTSAKKPLYIILLGIVVIGLIIFGPRLFSKKEEIPEKREVEIRPEIPQEIIGADKIAIVATEKESETEEAKESEGIKEQESPEKEKAEETKEAAPEEAAEPKVEEKPPKKQAKKKAGKKELQDILDNV
ncbi:Uncharacterised protein [uncultured archaeon]|nr:Uncharacterised protein [uncultured archaeon]